MFAIAAALAAAVVSSPPDAPRFGHLKLSTGIRIHYAEQGSATAPPIILLHGYSDSWFSYSLAMTPLARRAHVYALDLRGHGNTDRPTSGYRMADLAADVIAFMDAQRIPRATIVGHSMGGLVAQQVALAAPSRVDHLVLIATAASLRDFAGIDDLIPVVRSLPDPVPVDFVREFQLSTAFRPVSASFMDRAIAESLKLPSRVWRELLDGMLATERAAALGQLAIPTLVLHGERDVYVPEASVDALATMLHAGRVRRYADTGHAVHWERPDEVAADILAFVARTAATRSGDS